MLDILQVIKANKGLPVKDMTSRLAGEILSRPKIYGWHVDPSRSDPAQAVSYLADAVGKTPAAMGESAFSYGNWKNAFFMPRPCMLRFDGTVAYYLNPNDYTKKIDGTPSDIANSSFEGNAMMEWPLIWYKFEPGEASGEGYFYCSDQQIDSSYKCWCNLDSNGNVIPHFYTAIYNGTGTSKLRSISGVQLTSANGNGDTTAAQDVTRSTANGTDWYIETLADRLLINALLVLMGKSLNTKAVYGNGVGALTVESTQALKESITTGMCNDKGLFWGCKNDYTHPVKVFGMENWWGCVTRRNAGLLCKDSKYYIKLTKGTSDGTTVNDYSFTSISGYIQAGVSSPQSSNLIKKMSFSQYGYFPAEVSSTNASWSSWLAVWNYYSEVSSALMGGVNYARTGAFEIDFTKEPVSAYTISSCLSCKPRRI